MRINEILKYDPDFTESGFKTFIDNVFIQIHLAIMMKEPEKIRHFVKEEIYQGFLARIKDLNEKHLIQMYDEINVKETHLLRAEVKDHQMFISVNIVSRYMDYLMDEEGNFVSGNNQSRIEKYNNLLFMKKITTEEKEKVKKCPGCGAAMDINANGKCDYCGTIYHLEEKGWVLVSFEVK